MAQKGIQGFLNNKLVVLILIGLIITSHIWMLWVGEMTDLQYIQHAWGNMIIGGALLMREYS